MTPKSLKLHISTVTRQLCETDSWFKLTTYRKPYFVSAMVTCLTTSCDASGDCSLVPGFVVRINDEQVWYANGTDRYLIPLNALFIHIINSGHQCSRQMKLLNQYLPLISCKISKKLFYFSVNIVL